MIKNSFLCKSSYNLTYNPPWHIWMNPLFLSYFLGVKVSRTIIWRLLLPEQEGIKPCWGIRYICTKLNSHIKDPPYFTEDSPQDSHFAIDWISYICCSSRTQPAACFRKAPTQLVCLPFSSAVKYEGTWLHLVAHSWPQTSTTYSPSIIHRPIDPDTTLPTRIWWLKMRTARWLPTFKVRSYLDGYQDLRLGEVNHTGFKNVCYWSKDLLNPSNAEATFGPKYTDAKSFENHLIPIMLVFMGKLSLSTLR